MLPNSYNNKLKVRFFLKQSENVTLKHRCVEKFSSEYPALNVNIGKFSYFFIRDVSILNHSNSLLLLVRCTKSQILDFTCRKGKHVVFSHLLPSTLEADNNKFFDKINFNVTRNKQNKSHDYYQTNFHTH